METLKEPARILQQRLKSKKCRKAIIQLLNSVITALDANPQTPSALEQLRSLIRNLKDVYIATPETGLKFADHLWHYLRSRNEEATTSLQSPNIRPILTLRWDAVCCSLIDGVLDFLEVRDSTYYKSVIASALYGTLAQALTSGLSSTIPKPLDANLLYSVYLLFSETAQGHADNKALLRDVTVLGSKQLGMLVFSTKSSAALEALLEIIGVLLPQEKSTPSERRERDTYIKSVFTGHHFRAGDQLVNLVQHSGRDWAKTSDAIIEELAKFDLHFPQPFAVESLTSGSYTFQLDSFYVDEDALVSTTAHDGVRETLRVTATSITDIDIAKPHYTGKSTVTVVLRIPPVLGSTSLSFPGKTPPVVFQLEESQVARFRAALSIRRKEAVQPTSRHISTSEPSLLIMNPDGALASTEGKGPERAITTQAQRILQVEGSLLQEEVESGDEDTSDTPATATAAADTRQSIHLASPEQYQSSTSDKPASTSSVQDQILVPRTPSLTPQRQAPTAPTKSVTTITTPVSSASPRYAAPTPLKPTATSDRLPDFFGGELSEVSEYSKHGDGGNGDDFGLSSPLKSENQFEKLSKEVAQSQKSTAKSDTKHISAKVKTRTSTRQKPAQASGRGSLTARSVPIAVANEEELRSSSTAYEGKMKNVTAGGTLAPDLIDSDSSTAPRVPKRKRAVMDEDECYDEAENISSPVDSPITSAKLVKSAKAVKAKTPPRPTKRSRLTLDAHPMTSSTIPAAKEKRAHATARPRKYRARASAPPLASARTMSDVHISAPSPAPEPVTILALEPSVIAASAAEAKALGLDEDRLSSPSPPPVTKSKAAQKKKKTTQAAVVLDNPVHELAEVPRLTRKQPKPRPVAKNKLANVADMLNEANTPSSPRVAHVEAPVIGISSPSPDREAADAKKADRIKDKARQAAEALQALSDRSRPRMLVAPKLPASTAAVALSIPVASVPTDTPAAEAALAPASTKRVLRSNTPAPAIKPLEETESPSLDVVPPTKLKSTKESPKVKAPASKPEVDVSERQTKNEAEASEAHERSPSLELIAPTLRERPKSHSPAISKPKRTPKAESPTTEGEEEQQQRSFIDVDALSSPPPPPVRPPSSKPKAHPARKGILVKTVKEDIATPPPTQRRTPLPTWTTLPEDVEDEEKDEDEDTDMVDLTQLSSPSPASPPARSTRRVHQPQPVQSAQTNQSVYSAQATRSTRSARYTPQPPAQTQTHAQTQRPRTRSLSPDEPHQPHKQVHKPMHKIISRGNPEIDLTPPSYDDTFATILADTVSDHFASGRESDNGLALELEYLSPTPDLGDIDDIDVTMVETRRTRVSPTLSKVSKVPQREQERTPASSTKRRVVFAIEEDVEDANHEDVQGMQKGSYASQTRLAPAAPVRTYGRKSIPATGVTAAPVPTSASVTAPISTQGRARARAQAQAAARCNAYEYDVDENENTGAVLVEQEERRPLRDASLMDISNLMHELTDALVDKIGSRFQDSRDCAEEGARRVCAAAAKELGSMRGEMITHYRRLLALETDLGAWRTQQLDGLRTVQAAQAQAAAATRELLAAHDRGVLSGTTEEGKPRWKRLVKVGELPKSLRL